MRIRQRVDRNIITSIRCMNIVLIYHICDVIKRMRKYAWSDVSRSSICFTYSSVARHTGPCSISTPVWLQLLNKASGFLTILHCLTTGSSRSTSDVLGSCFAPERENFSDKTNIIKLENKRSTRYIKKCDVQKRHILKYIKCM